MKISSEIPSFRAFSPLRRSCGSTGCGRKGGVSGRRSWVPRVSWVLVSSYNCSYPRPPQTRTMGRAELSFVPFFCLSGSFVFFSFVISLGATHIRGTGLGGGPKGSLQRAATAKTADGKTGQNVRRHSLDRLLASMIKQNKKPTTTTTFISP